MSELRSFCRTCGIKLDNKWSSTKLFEKSNYQLIRLIEDITDMFLEFENSMPDHICDECKQQLDSMLAFRLKFLKVHHKFLATKKKHLQGNSSDKMGTESVKDDQELVDGSAPQEEELLQMAYEDTDDMEDSDDQGDEGLFLEIQLDQDKLGQEDYEEEHTEVLEPEEELQDHENKLEEPKEFLEEDGDQITGDLSVSPKKTKRILSNKAQLAKRNAKTWVCEQCGGVFKCSTYLKLHQLRHTGQKSFECDICKAKYYTKNEMRRHRILHTDARPFACRFCGKTFRGCSSKVIHERSHTNVRPFQCQYCEMSFTSTSTRQRHEILHTNNRKYHCEICQQRFVRATHLALHQNSKLHKKRVASAAKS